MVTVTVTAKFHNPSLSRRKEWQRATRLYRDTKQFCIDGWENGDFGKSVTTASIDNDLYSAIQNQAIREAKSDHNKDGEVRYRESQPFAINTRIGNSIRPRAAQSSSASRASPDGGTHR